MWRKVWPCPPTGQLLFGMYPYLSLAAVGWLSIVLPLLQGFVGLVVLVEAPQEHSDL